MPSSQPVSPVPPSILRETARWLRPFWWLAALSTAFGTLSGFATAWLLATINEALNTQGGATMTILLTFGGLTALSIGAAIVSDIANGVLGQRVVANLRAELCTKIVTAPIPAIERFQVHRLMATLNQDIESVSAFAFSFASLAVALAVVIGCITYLIVLSPLLFGVTAVAIAIGIVVHTLARNEGIKGLEAARQSYGDLYRHFQAISEGAKELRINRPRRFRVLHHQAIASIRRIADMNVRAIRIYAAANVFGSLLFFLVIGAVLLAAVGTDAKTIVISGFVIVLLYMKGPMEQLVLAIPMTSQAQVAMRRIAEMSAHFATREPHLAIEDRAAPDLMLETIELAGASYTYPPSAAGDGFTLGPLDLTIRRGEILFITGENGCGKTTLIKLILGLYAPDTGVIKLNGEPLGDADRDDYRQFFSAIFFDFHLFADLIGNDAPLSARVDDYLQKLEIAHKVGIEDGAFTTIDLSAGQRKRLALIQVYLEDRAILVFDEWAAEQDPTFRRIFYEEILADLKRQGKTMIVVSHDDRYFHAADRQVVMEGGRITTIETIPNA